MHRQRYVYDQLILCQKRLGYTDNSNGYGKIRYNEALKFCIICSFFAGMLGDQSKTED